MSNRNLALIGAGYWGKNLARNFNRLGALHTLCDLSPDILASYGEDYSDVQKTDDLASIWADKSISRVAIAAPAEHHFSLAETALRAGKDVYVEKPLCLKIEDAESLTVLARSHDRILMVGHLLQYHPHVVKLHEWVREGVLGELKYISSNRLSMGKFRREENVLWSFAPHDLSVILSLAQNELPSGVTCAGSGQLVPDIEDTIVTNLSFDSGLRAHVYASWINPFKEQKLTVIGTRSSAVFDDTLPWAEKLARYEGSVVMTPQGPVPRKVDPIHAELPEGEPLRAECEHFITCCRDRRRPRTDGEEGIRVLKVLQAAQLSLKASS